jgi:quercetin dioxygenase-like cupin family protein
MAEQGRFAVTNTIPKLVGGIGVLAATTALHHPSFAANDHPMVTPIDIKWEAAPPVLPKGAQVAVLYGDPSKDGLFALRVKMPADYLIPPHAHPKPEIVTVVSGTVNVGDGATADKSNAKAFPAGSFFVMPPGMQHFVFADQETVVQVNTTGPWGITYVNEKDDPRKTQ